MRHLIKLHIFCLNNTYVDSSTYVLLGQTFCTKISSYNVEIYVVFAYICVAITEYMLLLRYSLIFFKISHSIRSTYISKKTTYVLWETTYETFKTTYMFLKVQKIRCWKNYIYAVMSISRTKISTSDVVWYM